jgi:hypothetical protein
MNCLRQVAVDQMHEIETRDEVGISLRANCRVIADVQFNLLDLVPGLVGKRQ